MRLIHARRFAAVGPTCRDLFRDETGEISPALPPKVRRGVAAQCPLGILGRPSDIAFALLYLASDASRFVTGQILAANGGEYDVKRGAWRFMADCQPALRLLIR
jgi:NAD(P)-dependent dehydrogenase (short-subunit alcohol dehydrogenase family)